MLGASLPIIQKKTYILSAILLAVLKCFYIFYYGPLASFDAPNYLGFAEQILGNETDMMFFGTEAIPLIQFRTAGYPLILAFIKILTGPTYLWAVIFMQSTLTILVSLYVLKVSRKFLNSSRKAIFVMVAYGTSELLMWDIFPQSDGVYTNLFVFFTLYALNNNRKNSTCYFLLLGGMYAYIFLIRDVTLYMTIFILPALLLMHRREGAVKNLKFAAIFLVPLVATYISYGSVNKHIHGEFFISSSGQFVPVQSLQKLAEEGVPIFDGDSIADIAMRKATKHHNLRDLYVYNEILMQEYSKNPREIDRLNKAKYFETWQRFPLDMTLQTLKNFFEKFSIISFNPVLNTAEVSRAAFEQTWPKKWQNVNGFFDAIFFLLVNLFRIISIILFTMSFMIFLTSLKSWREERSAQNIWLYSVTLGFAAIYCTTHIEARYLLTTIPLIIMTALYRTKSVA